MMLTKAQAAQELGVSVRTIERMLKDRQLGHSKVRNCVRISDTSVALFKARAEVKAVVSSNSYSKAA